jgi:hypothetical protein
MDDDPAPTRNSSAGVIWQMNAGAADTDTLGLFRAIFLGWTAAFSSKIHKAALKGACISTTTT